MLFWGGPGQRIAADAIDLMDSAIKRRDQALKEIRELRAEVVQLQNALARRGRRRSRRIADRRRIT